MHAKCVWIPAVLAAMAGTHTLHAQETVTWRGVNTAALYNHLQPGPYDLSPFTNANTVTTGGYDLWSPARVPGTGDTADFVFDSTTNVVWSYTTNNVVIDGGFSPDHLRVRTTLWNTPHRGSEAQVMVDKDLTVQTLYTAFGYSSAGQGENNIRILAGRSLTLTADVPWTFAAQRGGWGNVQVDTGAALRFGGANQTFATFNWGNVLGGGGSIEFTMPSATVTLGDPGLNANPSIALSAQSLRIRSDQTWLNPTRTGWISRRTDTDKELLQSIDGAPLNNLSNVAFRVELGTVGNYSYYIPAGTYQSLNLRTHLTYGRGISFRLSGDVGLAGGVVVPGNGTVAASETNDSLRIIGSSQGSSYAYLESNSLTTARGVLLSSENAAGAANAAARMHAPGATLDIGGDLTYRSNNFPAGTTNAAGALAESRIVGIVGDTNTVLSLRGSFVTNVRSPTGGGLVGATIALLGGSAGAPNTFEVGCDPADAFANDTYALGAVSVGTATEPGHVRLVNDFLNDNDATNVNKVKAGEMLLARRLAIGSDSSLDLNGLAVRLDAQAATPTLSVAATGALDLNTGLALQVGDTVPTFVGPGNHADAWNAFRDRVKDSSLPGAAFLAVATKDPLPFGGSSNELTFDGVNDFIDLRTIGDGLGTSFTTFTVELWARAVAGPTANGGYGLLMYRTSSTSTSPAIGGSLYWLGINAAGDYAAGVNGNLTGDTGVEADTTTWRHLALTYDGTTQRVYLDGELKASVAQALTNSKTVGNLGIGSAPLGATYRPTLGSIAEVRVWNVARSQADIESTRMQRLAGNESGLVSYWPLDDGSGTTSRDGMAGSRAVTLSGAAWDTGNTYWTVAPAGGTLLLVR